MLRTFALSVLALTCVVSGTATAAPYLDEERRFEVTIPEGWTHVAGQAGSPIGLGIISSRFKQTLGLCVLISIEVAGTRKTSQAIINEELAKEVDDAFWRGAMQDKNAKDVTIASRSEMRGDRRVFLATAQLTTKLGGEDVPVQTEMALHVVPGRMLVGQCGAKQAELAAEQAAIKTVMETFNPTGEAVVAGFASPPQVLQGTSTLSLFAGPAFDGSAREIGQDAPVLGGMRVASFAVRGRGLWEICDRANFQGNCRVVAGASAAAHGDPAPVIGSARRVSMTPEARMLPGVAYEAVGSANRALHEKMAARRIGR
jgi:hypothetical protein